MTQTPSSSLEVSAAFRAGWRGFTANTGPLVVVALIVWVVSGAVNSLTCRSSSGRLVAVVWISLALAIFDGRRISGESLLPNG